MSNFLIRWLRTSQCGIHAHQSPFTPFTASGAVEGGDLLIHRTETVGDGATDTDEQPGGGTWILVDVAFEGFTVDAPDLGKFDCGNTRASNVRIEQIEFADSFAFLNLDKQYLVTAAHGSCVEFARDDEEEAILLLAFLNEMLAGLHGKEFAVTAKDVAIFFT